jgi:hypothetical protein
MRLSRKRTLFISSAAVVLVVLLVWLWNHKNTPPEPKPRTAEDILNERTRLAGELILESPLAKSLLAKNWEVFRKDYLPARDGRKLADVIRAFHIQSKMSDFDPAEKDELLKCLIQAIDAKEPKAPQDPLVMAQIERLPEARTHGDAEKLLLKWLQRNGTGTEQKWLAVRKLAAQRLQPRKDAVETLRGGLYRADRGESEKAWSTLEQMRSVTARQRLMEEAVSQFSRIPDHQQGRALGILSGGLPAKSTLTSRIKSITTRFLKSDQIEKIEGALLAIGWLHRSESLTPAEQGEIVRILTAIPEASRTPFIQAKSEEIIRVFQP